MNRALSRAAALTFLPALALTIVFSARVTDFGSMDGYPVGLFSQAALTVGVVARISRHLAEQQTGPVGCASGTGRYHWAGMPGGTRTS